LGLPIELPPLRERENDVIILAGYFIGRFCAENKIPLKKLSSASQKKIMTHTFPGNVRELKSIVELAVTLSDNDEIEPGDLLIEAGDPLSEEPADSLTMRQYEIKIIKATLRKNNNDIRIAAEKLDIGVSTIYRILKEEKG
jgi:DNA-binding NtrC family response regulator